MTWLVTGATGQLGTAFRRALLGKQNVCFANRSICDLGNPSKLSACLERETPDVIINCAAYTAVDAAEKEQSTAWRINADAVGEMARWAAEHDALMVHFSTDYVFDGTAEGAYFEDTPVNPLSVYGQSKAAGEALFFESGVRGVCLRTSWVHSNEGHNFFLTIKKLLRERPRLRVVNDQFGVPTTTSFLTAVTCRLIDLREQGKVSVPSLIHAVPDGEANWFSFASHIRDEIVRRDSGASLGVIEPIPSSEFPQVATRPSNSVMSNLQMQLLFGEPAGRWEDWHNDLHGR